MVLEKGADVNAEGGEFDSVLHAASSRGHRELVQMLLEGGATKYPRQGAWGHTSIG